MKRRWLAYGVVGALFGVFDFFYLTLLYKFPGDRVFGAGSIGQLLQFVILFVVLNLGVWLVPVIPVALHEVRYSRSMRKSALAGLLVWSAGIVAYYLTNAAQLAWGVPGREELALANVTSPYFWSNWASVFQGSILGGIVEYMPLALIGGLMVGLITGWCHLGRHPAAAAPA